ncbi:Lysophospholipase, alpha-beta hydrolase superfamily [Paramicrobacterium humi]|uniref:Lysophospholipase, alpha-beta hydrolase superfamily n=1 Tax=Paramicrobacterium humi TaxID=640635 RepID=A0A1H4JMF8_9MICO|nr:Lysophospholipase, alpha-beta hydrolase superfamily [Microbacterium humi]
MSWRPDVLGEKYEQTTLELEPDAQGEVVATLVRRTRSLWQRLAASVRPLSDVDVLYVHGWADYFFQTELAELWEQLGARFHALDLRKYGRSLREHQTPGFISDLATYDEDIDAALEVMGHAPDAGNGRRLIVMAHSTGGLTMSLWAHRHPGRVAALVLNSPWLEFQIGGVGREVLTPMLELGARISPLRSLPQVDFGFYTRTISNRFEGEWEIDPRWRPDQGAATHSAWLAAVFAGQRRVATGLSIDAPVLVLLSSRSTIQRTWSEQMRSSDIVLNVDEVAQRVPQLGSCVTLVRLDGALHDVLLSAKPVREKAKGEIHRWLGGYGRKPKSGDAD